MIDGDFLFAVSLCQDALKIHTVHHCDLEKMQKKTFALPTLIKNIFSWLLCVGSLILLSATPARAEVIDRIQINQAGDEAEIRLRFLTRVQFIRQVMLKNGDIRLYFNLLDTDTTDKQPSRQRKESPPSNLVPRFTVTYPEIDSSLTISFGKELFSYHVRPGNDGRSISLFVPIAPSGEASPAAAGQQPIPAATPAPAKRTAEEIELTESEAKQLMVNATAAHSSNLPMAQASILRKLVNLPPNSYTQSALQTLAALDEKLGEFDKARIDYLTYMKLYPKAKDYKQMEDGVARMIMAIYANKKSVPEQIVVEDKIITFGSFSQYFNKGLLHADSTFVPNGVTTSTNSTYLSQLLSTLDITSMKRTASTETRLVFRDTFNANLPHIFGNSNFLDAAYLEQALSDQSYFYGLGRQTGASGGVPSRFDGAWLGHNFNDAWRINGTFGQPVRVSNSNEPFRTFADINITLTRQPGQWSGNAYTLAQRVGKILDRRVVGMEAHYYDSKRNRAVLTEYDTLFKRFNIASLQGNWITASDDNYTLFMEHRRSPFLQATSALRREFPTQTIPGLFNAGATATGLRDNALLATPIINQFSVGMTHPYSATLKLGGDLRFSNITRYEGYDFLKAAVGVFPRVNSTTYSVQAIGNNLLFDNDLGTASASYTNASTYKARSLSFSQVETFRTNWRLDLALFLYAENNNLTGDTTRITPSFKLSYQKTPLQNFEFGAGFEKGHMTTATLDTQTRRRFFNLGYRWDFQ